MCSAFDVPEEPPGPDEIPETPQDKRRLRIWFWILFLSGPLVAVLASVFRNQSVAVLPAWLQPFPATGMEGWLALPVCALGGGFCIARLIYPRRRLGEQFVVAFALGLALMVAYAALAVVAVGFVHLLVYKVIK